MINVETIRKDFPIFKRKVRGKPLVYLDSAATSQRPATVTKALEEYHNLHNSNVHRGIHTLSEEATNLYEGTRKKVTKLIGAPDPKCIVFTKNATEAINLVANAWGVKFLRPGDWIILTEMEHHSNLVPWQLVAQKTGASLGFIGVNDDGTLRLEELPELLKKGAKILALTHISNVLGTVNPIAEIIKIAHNAGTLVLVDGAQGAPHMPVNVVELDCDFLVFSGHKMLGPTGVGVLYGKAKHLEEMDPFLGGGDMISEVWLDHARWNELPWKFEAGTPNVGGVIAFGPAIDYLEKVGLEEIRVHSQTLAVKTLHALANAGNITVYGPTNSDLRSGVVSFNINGIHPHDVGTVFDSEGIAVRAGHHCCQPLMRRFGLPGTVRASFYLYNDYSDVEILVKGIKKVQEVFAPVTR